MATPTPLPSNAMAYPGGQAGATSIQQPATGVGSASETNRLLGGGYFDTASGTQLKQFTPPVSTTTASNATKVAAVPGIQATTAALSTKGSTYSPDGSGAVTAANGTVTPPPAEPTPPPAGTYTDSMGQVHTALADGSTPPAGSTPDGNGNYVTPDGQVVPAPAGDTSSYDKQIFNSIDSLKAQVAANLASQLDTIKSSYATLIANQQQINSGAAAKVQNALLMGGVTGQGSISQYASISADQQVTAQLNYGLQQITDLNTKEDQAIQNANAAATTQDIQLQDQYNTQINKIRDQAASVASKMQDALIAANQKKSDQMAQANKDAAISSLYSQGITSPSEILKKLQANGNTDITLKDITDSLASVVPPGISDMVKTMEANGAPTDIITKVLNSQDMASAITNAGDWLKNATGDMGIYLAYKRDAEASGHIPQDYATWQKAQDAKTLKTEEAKAYGTAFASASGKAAAEAKAARSSLVLTPVTDSRGVTSSVPTSVAPYMSTAGNGVRYVDLSGFKGTPTEANQAVADAQAAGLKVIVNKNSALDVQNITDAMAKLNDMQTAFSKITSSSAAERDSFGAAFTKMASALQTNPDVVASNVYEDAALDVLKAMSGVQGFRGGASMVAKVQSTFPTATDTTDVANAKIAVLKQLIGDRETALVGKPSASDQALTDGANAKDAVNTFYKTANSQTQGVIDKLITGGMDDTKVLEYLKLNNLYK